MVHRVCAPPRKLYYTAISSKTFVRIRRAMFEAGLIPEMPSEAEIARRGAPEDSITTAIDVRDTLEKKIAALRCHRTQLAPTHPWLNLPLEFRRQHMGVEFFTMAAARDVSPPLPEEDLFAGIVPLPPRVETCGNLPINAGLPCGTLSPDRATRPAVCGKPGTTAAGRPGRRRPRCGSAGPAGRRNSA